MALTTQQIEHYRNEGYLLVDRLIDSDSITQLSRDMTARVEGVAKKLYADGRLESLCEDEPFDRRLAALCGSAKDPEALSQLWRAVELKYYDVVTPGMFGMMTHPALLQVVEQLIGPEILFHPQSNARAKLPNHQDGMVSWHQDSVGLTKDSENTLTINFWIPLVDVTMDMGGMQVMLGRHHERPVIWDTFHIPDHVLPKDEIVDVPVPRGGALMIQKRTLHRSIPNTSNKVRWSLDFRYCRLDQPAGRPGGFVVRSEKHPERVIRTFEQYQAIAPTLKTA